MGWDGERADLWQERERLIRRSLSFRHQVLTMQLTGSGRDLRGPRTDYIMTPTVRSVPVFPRQAFLPAATSVAFSLAPSSLPVSSRHGCVSSFHRSGRMSHIPLVLVELETHYGKSHVRRLHAQASPRPDFLRQFQNSRR